ncbi:HmuY family protein [Arenibacter palladensis]|uniref:HmuY family protein n=1 Tax=Arenibacter palladensis TaxID=237373 RepID=UPI0026E23DE6|nr:HmuY family protein [Arenibacter palladensis]MDO6601487.1 HmuY family protein [Arenibacter palladensis]
MKKAYLFNYLLCILIFSSCSDDDKENLIDFSVSFSSATVGLGEADSTKELLLNYSRSATEAGIIKVTFVGNNAEYGTDFTTSPDGSSGTISIPVTAGDLNSKITFTKLENAIEGSSKSVAFSINGFDNTEWSTGTTSTSDVSFTAIPALSGVIDSENGGSNMPNQVYFDFSTGTQTSVRRDTWEIAFFNGAENRVFLNSSLLVSAVELPGETDLLSITESTVLKEPMNLFVLNFATFQQDPIEVTTISELLSGLPVGYSQYGNIEQGKVFTDNGAGTLDGTAFGEISTTPEDNNVYIVGLGTEIPTEAAEPGSINATGAHRGFMKVRVLTDGNSYTIQYAPLEETSSITEVSIPKDDAYSISAFSLTTGKSVNVEPQTTEWDINLSGVFSYYGYQGPTLAGLTYSDYVVHNTLGGVGLYQVTTSEVDSGGNTIELDVPSYSNFSMVDVNESAFVYDNRAVVGSGWRDAFGGVLKDDRYYILKDASGNYYKMVFTAYLNNQGERGNPQFTYARL